MTLYARTSYLPYGPFSNGLRCQSSYGQRGRTQEEVCWPWYCDMDAQGDMVIADTDNCRIQFVSTRNNTSVCSYGHRGNQDKELMLPRSVKISPLIGTSFVVADTGNSRVVFLLMNALKNEIQYVGSFRHKLLSEPVDVAINNSNGNVVIVDESMHRVSFHNQYGELIGLCKTPNFELREPSAVAISSVGDILVSDTGNSCIRIFNQFGDLKASIGRMGSAIGQFNGPRGMCFDKRGYLFIADEKNNRVQMISPDLTHITEAVTSIPLPKGVASHNQLLVTCADPTGFCKVYYQ